MDPSVIDDHHAIGIAHDDIPRCAPTDSISKVATALESASWDVCAVVNDAGVLLGSVAQKKLKKEGAETVSDVMHEGPQTVRADEEIPSLAERMDELKLDRVFVTDPDGRLFGMVTRADVQTASIHSGA
jgi:arabinose-5-phosphate isomerase